VGQSEIKGLVIPKRGTIARGICCAAGEKSRFLADKPGFGMTRAEVLLQTVPPPYNGRLYHPLARTLRKSVGNGHRRLWSSASKKRLARHPATFGG